MKTKIEWCDETVNPVTGCTPISAGCDHCYAAAIAKRFWGGREFHDIRFHPKRLKDIYKGKKPKKKFIGSMCDLFHYAVEWNWQYKIFEAMLLNPFHTYIILTKRPKALRRLTSIYFHLERNHGSESVRLMIKKIWIGVTAENQEMADKRIPALLKINAAVKFISVEPMLELIDLSLEKNNVDWVICGAETGPGAREMDINWALDVKNQCKSAGVPFFFKKASKDQAIPNGLMIREFPK